MEAFAPYLFVIIIAIPAILLIAQVSGSLGQRRVESERERVLRQQHENNLRRSHPSRRREQLTDTPHDQDDEFTAKVMTETFDKLKPHSPHSPDETRRR